MAQRVNGIDESENLTLIKDLKRNHSFWVKCLCWVSSVGLELMYSFLQGTMRKIILITGGSRGIGAATAYLAAERGYTVCITYRQRQDKAKTVVETILENGGQAIALQADVSLETDVARLFSRLDEQAGSLTALVNKAGVLEQQSRVDEMTSNRLNRVLSTNVIGPFLCAKEAVKRMSTKYGGSGGSIVNVSSAAARLGSPHEYVDYAASKGAIDTMTIGLAKEVAGENIRVNAVRPGFIETDIHSDGGEPNRIERVKTLIPMKRGGQAVEVARAIMWLSSKDASYTTGSFIEVTGGR